MRLFMRCFGVLACLTLVLSGCSSYTGDISEWKAPVLSKDWNTVVELSDNVDFGDQVSGTFSTQKALTGFVFDAHQGARVTVHGEPAGRSLLAGTPESIRVVTLEVLEPPPEFEVPDR